MKYALAIDIGASSGRHIVGWEENGELKTCEVYRFRNGVSEENGHLVWDTEHLLSEVKEGIRIAKDLYPLTSLSIDTWVWTMSFSKAKRKSIRYMPTAITGRKR